MPQGRAFHVDAPLQLVALAHQVALDVADLAVPLAVADLHFARLRRQLESGDLRRRAVDLLFPVGQAGFPLQPLHLARKLAAGIGRRRGGERLVAEDDPSGGGVHGGVRPPNVFQRAIQIRGERGNVGRYGLVVSAGHGVCGQRPRLDAGEFERVKQAAREPGRFEMIEEHGQVRLAMRLGARPFGKAGHASSGPVDVELKGAELVKPELHEHAEPVRGGVGLVVLEQLDGFREIDAVAVRGVLLADLEVAVVAGDPFGEQREGPFYVHEVRHAWAAMIPDAGVRVERALRGEDVPGRPDAARDLVESRRVEVVEGGRVAAKHGRHLRVGQPAKRFPERRGSGVGQGQMTSTMSATAFCTFASSETVWTMAMSQARRAAMPCRISSPA